MTAISQPLPPRTFRALLLVTAAAAVGGAVPAVGLERVLFLAMAATGALVVTYRPHWGVLALSALWIFQLTPVRFGPITTADLIVGLLLVPLAVQIVRDRSLHRLGVPQFLILLGIGLVLLAATAWAELMLPPPPDIEAFNRTSSELRAFATGLIFFVLFLYFIRTARHVRVVLGFLTLVILVAVLDGFRLAEAGLDADRLHASQGFAGNSNRLALFAVWGTALFWCLRARVVGRWWRHLTLLPLLLLPVTVVMTGSRNGLLQLLLLAGLILMEQRHWSPAQRVRGIALIVTVGLLVAAAAPSALLLRATSFEATTDAPGGESLRNRAAGVSDGIAIVARNPILGVGPGNFRWHSGHDRGVHNSFLWAVTAGGPLLLLLYVVLFRSSLRAVRAAERHGPSELRWMAKAVRFNLIVFVAFSLFADTWLQHPFFLLIGVAAVLGRLGRGSEAAPPSSSLRPA